MANSSFKFINNQTNLPSNPDANTLYRVNDGVYLGDILLSYLPADQMDYEKTLNYYYAVPWHLEQGTVYWLRYSYTGSSFTSDNTLTTAGDNLPTDFVSNYAYKITFNAAEGIYDGEWYCNAFGIDDRSNGREIDSLWFQQDNIGGYDFPCSIVLNSNNEITQISIKILDGETLKAQNGTGNLYHCGKMDGRTYGISNGTENPSYQFCIAHGNSSNSDIRRASTIYTVNLNVTGKGQQVGTTNYKWASDTYSCDFQDTSSGLWNVNAYNPNTAGTVQTVPARWVMECAAHTSTSNECIVYAHSIIDGYNYQYFRYDPIYQNGGGYDWSDASVNFNSGNALHHGGIITFTAN